MIRFRFFDFLLGLWFVILFGFDFCLDLDFGFLVGLILVLMFGFGFWFGMYIWVEI